MKYPFKTQIMCDVVLEKKSETKPHISIGILSLFRSEQTIKCLESIRNSICNDIKYDIIILDNFSDIETRKIILEYAKTQDNITVIFSPFNLRVSRSRNLLAEYTKSDYIIFIDNDMIISSNYIAELYKMVNGKNMIAFGKIIENDRVLTIGRNIINNKIDFSNDRLFLTHPLTFKTSRVGIGPGGSTIFPVKLFNKVCFDSDMFDHEDWDLCLNLKKNYPEYLYMYNPAAVCMHTPMHDASDIYGSIRRNNNSSQDARGIIYNKWGVEC